jgi:hypothetical protein
MNDEITEVTPKLKERMGNASELAKASIMGGAPPFGEGAGTFYMPYNSALSKLGLTPEKLVVPREYHQVLAMCYDFYERGGLVTTVINRLAELTITEIRNGQRKTSNEANNYFDAVLHRKPSRLMRFLFNAALEYYISGMVLPKIEWEEREGREVSAKLTPGKMYDFPVFDNYPPALIKVEWAGWGKKSFYLKVPTTDLKLIRKGAAKIKEQQLKLQMWESQYPSFVAQIRSGSDMVLITDTDPILRKEKSNSAYPTPLLTNALEALMFKQQLRRMDFAVASRIINAILLVKEGNDNYPLTDETRENLDKLEQQILARSNNPRLMERLFILFTNHTTTLEWITPDVTAMLDQEKYKQVNEELNEALGFARILVTGESRYANASEVSTWAIQPQMEQFRTMAKEWLLDLYEEATERNKFRNTPEPNFKPIRLQDIIKTAAVFQAAFTEGNVSRTSRAESIGLDFETEVELMNDEKPLMEGLDAFPAMPYSPPPPVVGGGAPKKPGGRPKGSSNVPVNKRNAGVKPKGQTPTARVSKAELPEDELMSDEEVVDLINKIALATGKKVTLEEVETTEAINDEV